MAVLRVSVHEWPMVLALIEAAGRDIAAENREAAKVR